MNWNNIDKALCPSCESSLIEDGIFAKCYSCGFKARTSKLADISLGKKNKKYQKIVEGFNKIKKYKTEQKIKQENHQKIFSDERMSNLKRMLHRGEITQKEFDLKSKV